MLREWAALPYMTALPPPQSRNAFGPALFPDGNDAILRAKEYGIC